MRVSFLAALSSAAVLAAALFSAGCDSSADGGCSGTEAECRAAACEQYAEAFCAKRLECLGEARMLAVGGFGTQEQCAAYMAGHCRYDTSLEDTLATPESIGVCTSALSAPGCKMLGDQPKECFFSGSREPGEACEAGSQCTAGRCDSSDGDYCNSVCAAPEDILTRGAYGSPCSGTASCQTSLICVNGKCADGQGEGQDCSVLDCNGRRSLYCDEQTQTCKLRPIMKVGEPCDMSTSVCVAGALCNEEQVCVDLPGEGEPCYEYEVCETDPNFPDDPPVCGVVGRYCDWDLWCNQDNACQKLVALGESCDPYDGPPCEGYDAACIDGVCKRIEGGFCE